MKFVLLLFVLLFATPAFAQESPSAIIAQLEADLSEQETISTAAAKDKQMARDFIDSAKEAQGKTKLFQRRIKRAIFAVELVRALVAAAVIRQKAEEQEAAVFSAPNTTDAMKKDVERLKKRKTQLEKELQTMRGN